MRLENVISKLTEMHVIAIVPEQLSENCRIIDISNLIRA